MFCDIEELNFTTLLPSTQGGRFENLESSEMVTQGRKTLDEWTP